MLTRITIVKKCTECGINPTSICISDVFLVRASGYSDVATCVAYEETSMDAFLQINGRKIRLGIKKHEVKTLAQLEERYQQDKGGTKLIKKNFENLSDCLVFLLTLYSLKKEMAPFRGFYFQRHTCFL